MLTEIIRITQKILIYIAVNGVETSPRTKSTIMSAGYFDIPENRIGVPRFRRLRGELFLAKKTGRCLQRVGVWGTSASGRLGGEERSLEKRFKWGTGEEQINSST